MKAFVSRASILLALAAFLPASPAFAQDYPNRVITLVAPFPPGGPSDTTARMIIGPMSKALGQQIIVENVSGAGGTIGSNRVAKAKPDGYTLTISGSGTQAAAEYLNKDLPYKSTDFDQIGLINVSPVVLVARSEVQANTLKDFVAYLKANEKKVTEADAGVGSISNLACSVFHAVAGVHPTVASYRGTPQATMDLVAGNVDFGCNQIVNIAQHIKSGKLKAFAVTGDTRSPMLPDVPTTTQAGMPQFNLTVWFGLSAPKDTPKPIIEKLAKALDTALSDT
jgi:tripartite-type tricarboxylate transporter receptor subunit TctC